MELVFVREGTGRENPEAQEANRSKDKLNAGQGQREDIRVQDYPYPWD